MFGALTDRFQDAIRKVSGRGRISESNVREAMAEVRTALLEADVHLDVVQSFTEHVQVSLLVADADGYPFYPDFKSFGRQFVYVPGFVYTPEIPGFGKGNMLP